MKSLRIASCVALSYGLLFTGACAAGQRQGDTERAFARGGSGEPQCTAALLKRATPYDSSDVTELVGRYHLVSVDTVPGYAELRAKYTRPGRQARPFLFDLWATDSIHRYWRTQWFTKARVPANQPIMGAIVGADTTGVSPDMPQIVIDGHGLSTLTIQFEPRMILDGDNIHSYPISVRGAWGFGGRFESGSLFVLAGADGKPLPPRAGFYCAFRVAQ